MKVIIIRNLFYDDGNKIIDNLININKNDKYIYLDIYYNKIDRLKYLWHILTASCVYSIYSRISKNFFISLAIILKKRVVFHWVHNDVLIAKMDIIHNNVDNKLFSYPIHLTDTPWFVNELKEINIKARFIPLYSLDVIPNNLMLPKEFSILILYYALRHDTSEENEILEIAEQYPNIKFRILGVSKPDYQDLPKNVELLIWNTKKLISNIENSVICIHFHDIDGISHNVIECLLYGKYVFNERQQYNHCYLRHNSKIIEELYLKFHKNELKPNLEGSNYIIQNFSKENFLTLSNVLTNRN